MSSIPAAPRSALIDCVKALACAAIVLHHLAFYGPVAELAREAAPGAIDWLAQHARMAVQVFLVLAGYLAAAGLAPQGSARFSRPAAKIGRRFVRLVVPYAVALVLVIVVSAAVRPWLDDPMVSPDPDLAQLLAHALLLHDVLGEDSLSAGVWYVAIDLQLFAFTVLLLAGVRRLAPQAWHARGGQGVVVLLTAASLLGFNRDPQWDIWAPYFFGAYGLGMMAWWAAQAADRTQALRWQGAIILLVLGALALDWRARIALAGGTAWLLAVWMRVPAAAGWRGVAALRWLGHVSYSVFLVHFAVCLLVNAVVARWWPASVAAGMLAMAGGFVLSVVAGGWLYQRVERHVPTWRGVLHWQAGLVGAGLLTAWLAALR